MSTPLEHLITILDEQGGTLAIAKMDDGEWVVSLIFGSEDEDSPMAAGAAHGVAIKMDDAVQAAAEEAGWKPAPPPGFLQTPGGEHRVMWTGPWPPPERMLLVTVADQFRWFPLEEILLLPVTLGALREGIASGTWAVQEFMLGSASKITDADIVDMTHVVRGAEYILVGPWEPPGVDDERPTVDGTTCQQPILINEGRIGFPAGVNRQSRCVLDKGHDGGHVPATAL